ncbi:MAG: Gfo/Idh/MocA family oxidoreductase [Verrucomicrobiota bacterium]|nr:Gfo/Idh/MocA family oxidoreductase [Verrucomicrobiota bacterium]
MQTLAIIGCGDFLRWQLDSLKQSTALRVVSVFDFDTARATKYAALLGAAVAPSAEAIFADAGISMVALFVPPWVRATLFAQAVAAGKHILCTKPLAANAADCQRMVELAKTPGIRSAVLYGRTGDAFVQGLRALFSEGRFGKLALYKQDWIHAYPQWNRWALDHDKNGGPFMDAMIHNLNSACHLMDSAPQDAVFFSSNLAHKGLMQADTEALHLRFADGGIAHLFITWAADLATYSQEGNDREHHDLFYLVTDKGWRITKEWKDGKPTLIASREGKTESIVCTSPAETYFDQYAMSVEAGTPIPSCLVSVEEAARDVSLLRLLEKHPGETVKVG